MPLFAAELPCCCCCFLACKTSSNMLGTTNHFAPYLCPINATVQFFVHQTTNNNVVASYHIQAGMWLLRRRLLVILRAYNALDRVFQYEIRNLVTAYKRASERPAVNGNNEDFLCEDGGSLALQYVCKPGRQAGGTAGFLPGRFHRAQG